MNSVGRIVGLLVVLAACLPSYGEILVYKLSETQTFYYEVGADQWEIEKIRGKGYLVVEVDYDEGTITNAELVEYGTWNREKWYSQWPLEGLELVRVPIGTKVTWAVILKSLGEDMADLSLLTGTARTRKIGTGLNQEVASSMKGYSLYDGTDSTDREFGMGTVSIRLYPTWTYFANNEDLDFDDTLIFIGMYLDSKGYEYEEDL